MGIKQSPTRRDFDLMDTDERVTGIAVYNLGIHSLPDELLLCIFSAYCNVEDKQYASKKYPFIVTISHVCRLWRCLALDTASFWTNIPLTIPQINMAEEYVTRSRNHPISVLLSTKATLVPIEELDRLAALIDLSILRWTHLTIEERLHGTMAVWLEAVFMDLEWTAQLRTLEILQTDLRIVTANHHPKLWTLFAETLVLPELTVLKTWNTPLVWDKILAANLTILDVRHLEGAMCPTYTQLYNFLSTTPNLRHLVLLDLEFSVDDGKSTWPINLSSLESLAVRFYGIIGNEVANVYFLKHLQVPKLQSLTVSEMEDLGEFFVDVLNGDPKKFHQVTSLAVLNVGLSSRNLKELYASFPNIKHLTLLEWSGWYDGLFAYLHADGLDPIFKLGDEDGTYAENATLHWPSLESITLNLPLWAEGGTNTLIRATQSRAAIGKDVRVSEEGVERWMQGDYLLANNQDLY